MTAVDAAECDLSPRAAPAGPLLTVRARIDFDTIYRENFRFVWRTAKRLGIEPVFLDDVVQETFVVVHRRLADFARRSSIKTWLYGIVRRVVADHRRGQRRKPLGTAEGRDRDLDSA